MQALQLRYYVERVDKSTLVQGGSAEANARLFPLLEKKVYWEHAADLRLPAYEEKTAYRFHTSGTELGFPTEQPWDEWTFRRSFCESSAIALARCGVKPSMGIIIGSPAFGALAKSYCWAAELLGLDYQTDDNAFSDDAVFETTLAFATKSHVEALVATPGALVTFVDQCKQRNVEPSSLGIKKIISGVGNFLSERHLALAVSAFKPDIVMEQGGKNEILHAPGAVRYDRNDPTAICQSGFLHYLPYVSHVQTVKKSGTAISSIEKGEQGLMLMSRLTVGKPGVVAYINDAGDYGSTLQFSDQKPCACGSTLPAFRFMGRAGGSLSNRLGDSLFTEEFGLALSAACRNIGFTPSEAVGVRIQIVLVRDPTEKEPDVLCWLLGVDDSLLKKKQEEVSALCEAFIKYWVGYPVYVSGAFSKYMVIGHGFVVDLDALPHAGRDKPQYKLAELVMRELEDTTQAAFARHITETMKTKVIF